MADAASRSSRWADGWILVLLFLLFGGALALFGGVRLWSFGPLALIGFLAFLFFWFRRTDSLTALRIPPGGIFFAAFIFYALIQSPSAEVPWDARVKALLIASGGAALFLWTQLAARGSRWKVLFAVALLLISLVAWYALILHFRGERTVWTLTRPEGYAMRASGTFMCPNHLANLLAMGMCLALGLLLAPGTGSFLKIIAGYGFLLFGPVLALTQSRSGVLGAGAGIGTLLLLAACRKGRRHFVVAIVAVPLLLAAAGWGVWRFGPNMRERVAMAVTGVQAGNDQRLICWRDTLEMIRERPVWGWGGGSYRWVEPRFQSYHWESTVLYAHNEYLQVQAEYGAVGAALLIAFVGVAMFKLVRRAVRPACPQSGLLAATAVSVMACGGVHALFDFNFHIFADSQFLLLVLGTVSSRIYEDGGWVPVRLPRRGIPWVRALCVAGTLFLGLVLAQALASYGLCFPARAARTAGEFDRSDRLYRRAIRIDPGAWEPRLGLARLLKTRAYLLVQPTSRPDWLEESLLRYREALERNPYEMEILFGISHLYEIRGEPEKALKWLEEMVRLRPDFPYYRSRMGVQLYRMGRLAEAKAAFEQVLKQDGSDEAARLHLPALQ
jgi:O-antigen ligase